MASFAPSRLFLYYGERLIEGTTAQDSGAQLRDGIKVVHKLGVCDEELWPYEIDKFADEPPQAAYAQAKQHTATRYYRVPQHLLQLKGCLAAGFPFVLGFVVLTSFETPEVARSGLVPMPSEDDEQLGGHAVCCVGYDDVTTHTHTPLPRCSTRAPFCFTRKFETRERERERRAPPRKRERDRESERDARWQLLCVWATSAGEQVLHRAQLLGALAARFRPSL